MSRSIPKTLREKVAAQAQHRCGYCLSSEQILGAPLEIDHIIPISLGGLTEEENLWLACSLCSGYKGEKIAALDPASGDLARLFNPRYQRWAEHFDWSRDGSHLVGLTFTGRVTVVALKLNRAALVYARRAWVIAGWQPPKE